MATEYQEFLRQLPLAVKDPSPNTIAAHVYESLHSDFPQAEEDQINVYVNIFETSFTADHLNQFLPSSLHVQGLLWGCEESSDQTMSSVYQKALGKTIVTPILQLLSSPLTKQRQNNIVKFLSKYNTSKGTETLTNKGEVVEIEEINENIFAEELDDDDFVWESTHVDSNESHNDIFPQEETPDDTIWECKVNEIFSHFVDHHLVVNQYTENIETLLISSIKQLLNHYSQEISDLQREHTENIIIKFSFILRDHFVNQSSNMPKSIESFIETLSNGVEENSDNSVTNITRMLKIFLLLNLFSSVALELIKKPKFIAPQIFTRALLKCLHIISERFEQIKSSVKVAEKTSIFSAELIQIYDILIFLSKSEGAGRHGTAVAEQLQSSEIIRVFVELFSVITQNIKDCVPILEPTFTVLISFTMYQPDLSNYLHRVKKVTDFVYSPSFLSQFPHFAIIFATDGYVYGKQSKVSETQLKIALNTFTELVNSLDTTKQNQNLVHLENTLYYLEQFKVIATSPEHVFFQSNNENYLRLSQLVSNLLSALNKCSLPTVEEDNNDTPEDKEKQRLRYSISRLRFLSKNILSGVSSKAD